MTIEKGEQWGEPAAGLAPSTTAADDAELAGLAAAALGSGERLVAQVLSGDLLATLGVDKPRPEAERFAYPIDLGTAYLRVDPGDAELSLPFVAHLTAGVGRRLPTVLDATVGRLLGHRRALSLSVMNAAWLGDLRLAPRGHPNDGLVDITEGTVAFGERREFQKRARFGSHLPHPDLAAKRVAEWETDFGVARPLWLDGVHRGRFRFVRVVVRPDALVVVA